MAGGRLLLLVALLAGCNEPTAVVVDVDSSIPLVALRADLTFAGKHQQTALPPGGGQPALPGAVRFILPDVAGNLTVALSGVDAHGATATASMTARTVPHRVVTIALHLRPGGTIGGDGGTIGGDGGIIGGDGGIIGGGDGGVLTIVAGSPGGNSDVADVGADARLNDVVGLALAGGTLWATESGSYGTLRAIDLTTRRADVVGMPSLQSPLFFSAGFALDGAGQGYLAIRGYDTLNRLTLASGAPIVFAGTGSMPGGMDGPVAGALFDGPAGVVFAAGTLYVADAGDFTLRAITLGANPTVSTLAGAAGMSGTSDTPPRFRSPVGLVMWSGNLYVADQTALRRVVIGPPVQVSTIATNLGTNLGALTVDGAGNFYLVDYGATAIVEVASGANSGSVIAGGQTGVDDAPVPNGLDAHFSSPGFLAADANYVYVADEAVIRRVALAGSHAVNTLVGTASHRGGSDGVGGAARFSAPAGIAVDALDADGAFVTEHDGARVRHVVISTGAVTLVAGGGMGAGNDGLGNAARFAGPTAVAVDGAGTVWVADSDGNSLRKITFAQGRLAPGLVATATAAGDLKQPNGLAVDDAHHRLFIADSGNGRIRLYDTMSGAITDWPITNAGAPLALNRPVSLAWDAARARLYIGEDFAGDVLVVDGVQATLVDRIGRGQPGRVSGAYADASFQSPDGLALDAGRQLLYVADTSSHAVRPVDLAARQVLPPVVGVLGVARTRPGALPANVSNPTAVTLGGGGLLITSSGENTLLLAR